MLAGGRSTRFGRDKLWELYRGAPLLHHAILRLGEVCGDVVVVVAPDAPEPGLPVGVPVRVARDPMQDEGPLLGLSAGLAEVRTGLALVAAGDMPDLQTAVLLEMVRVAEDELVEGVALQDGDHFRPLPCVVRADRAREVARTVLRREERRLRTLLQALRLAVVDEQTWRTLDPDGRTLRDVDEPGDLEV